MKLTANEAATIQAQIRQHEKAPNFGNKECFFFEPEPSMGLPFDSTAEPTK